MGLYELEQRDIDDLRALISSAALTINAAQAQRIVQLQTAIARAPSKIVDELLAVNNELRAKVRELELERSKP